jgi:VanZ family protein
MLKFIRNNIFSICATLVVTYLSLANSSTFDEVDLLKLPDFDKVVHLGMYFFLTLVILIEHRFKLITGKSVFIVALIAAAYGILMEVIQMFTLTRSGDVLDAIADLAGVALAILFWRIAGSRLKQVRLL